MLHLQFRIQLDQLKRQLLGVVGHHHLDFGYGEVGLLWLLIEHYIQLVNSFLLEIFDEVILFIAFADAASLAPSYTAFA